MTIRVSTGLRNKLWGSGRADITGYMRANTISYDSASKEIRDSGNGFLAAGFRNNDEIRSMSVSNNALFTALAVAAGVITVSESVTDESVGTVFALAAACGVDCGGFRDIMRDCVLRIYSGAQLATADAAVVGTLLLEFTKDGLTFAHGSQTGGLNWGNSSGGIISKPSGDTWKATGLAANTATWFRFCGNPTDDGSLSTTLPRVDGTVATSSADLLLTDTTIEVGDIHYINDFDFELPFQYGA